MCPVPTTKPCPPPSPIHLKKFIGSTQQTEALIDVQRFSLAFIEGNPLSASSFSKIILAEPTPEETIIVQVLG